MYIKNRLSVDKADDVYHVTKKFVVMIGINLDTDVSDAKIVAALLFPIDWKNRYAQMYLTEKIVILIHLVFRLAMLFVNK